MIREFALKVTVTLVPSQKNKTDQLTRVKKAWLKEKENMALVCCAVEKLKDLHFGKYAK